MNQPAAYIDFEVYENSVNYLGIAQIKLPDISFLTQSITGSGIAGNVETVLTGMVDAMTLEMQFRSAMDAAVSLMKPVQHTLDIRAAEQYWNTVAGAKQVMADKYVVVVMPKTLSPGDVAPATTANTSGQYAVYYYAGYKDGKRLWEIDPYNYKCEIDGVDYMADVRKALGK